MKHTGEAVSAGVAVGRVFVHTPFAVTVTERHFDRNELPEQKRRYAETVARAGEELVRIREKLAASDPDKAAIVKAHLEILHDEALTEEIADCIERELCSPDWAVEKVYVDSIALFDDVDDPLIKERVADLRDVRGRILRNWHGIPERDLSSLGEETVIVAYDLMPTETATLDREKVLAIVTEVGGATSHTAIIARSYGIPAVVGVPGLLAGVRHGDEIAVDAIRGEVIVGPSPADKERLAALGEEHARRARAAARYVRAEPLTADGVRVDIGLNIGSGDDGALEPVADADFVGLFRTEFLYMESPTLPDEEAQLAVYAKVLRRCGSRPVVIRTLDVGGDKHLSCIDMPREDNPFLGNRALRLCFSRPDIFESHLRALLRASVHGNLWLMLPMVGSIDDIRRSKEIIAGVRRDLEREGLPFSRDMKIGIMIEIPSIALMADVAAREVDFASIGTNDLCQYLTAVDRLNPAVAQYCQKYHPALFRLVGDVADAFNAAGKPISVCGEMGGDPLAAAALVGLGLRKLSMGPHALGAVKHMLSTLTLPEMENIAADVRRSETASEAERRLRESAAI